MNLSKKLIVVFVVICMLITMFAFKVNVKADLDPFKIRFVAEGNHTVVVDANHIKIDGQFVDPKWVSNPGQTANYTITAQNDGYNIFPATEPVTLEFNAGNAFSLKNGDNLVASNVTTFSGDTTITLCNYVKRG